MFLCDSFQFYGPSVYEKSIESRTVDDVERLEKNQKIQNPT